MADTIDKILDKLPYSDGSLRRRFVSGGIVLVGAFVISLILYSTKANESLKFLDGIKIIFNDFETRDILKSPILVGIAVLSVYALGNLVEMVGEIFLVRAAAGMFWAMSYPKRMQEIQQNKNQYDIYSRTYFILRIYAILPLILYYFTKGLLGYAEYQTEVLTSLSEKAKLYYERKIQPEEKVVLGLSCPVGNNAETAWKFLVDQFELDTDKLWARKAIGRVRDVLAITTALIIVFISITVLVSLVFPLRQWPAQEIQEALLKSNSVYIKYQGKEKPPSKNITRIIRGITVPTDLAAITQLLEEAAKERKELHAEHRRLARKLKALHETQAEKLEMDPYNQMVYDETMRRWGAIEAQLTYPSHSPNVIRIRDWIEGREKELDGGIPRGEQAKRLVTTIQKERRHQLRTRIMEVLLRTLIIAGIAIFFMYTYQAYLMIQKNVIESLIETLSIKEGQQ